MKYAAVIFDLFGTLVDNFSFEGYERVLHEMALALGLRGGDFARLWAEEATFNMRLTGAFGGVEGNIEHVCVALGGDPEPSRIAAAARMRVEFTRRGLLPRADAVHTLSTLRAAGCKTGLVSDCTAEVPLLWSDTPLAPLMDATVFSCVELVKKPDPRMYELACERLAVAPGDCLYVGDGGSRELTGAAKAGMHPVLIRVPYDRMYDPFRPDAEEWKGPRISTLEEILALVEEEAPPGGVSGVEK
jgi:putative hydrolase of the HAD superfamily